MSDLDDLPLPTEGIPLPVALEAGLQARGLTRDDVCVARFYSSKSEKITGIWASCT